LAAGGSQQPHGRTTRRKKDDQTLKEWFRGSVGPIHRNVGRIKITDAKKGFRYRFCRKREGRISVEKGGKERTGIKTKLRLGRQQVLRTRGAVSEEVPTPKPN